MPRTINPQRHAAKRDEILDAVARLIYLKGYERMTIQDILAETQISGGAFYHYFASKAAVLEGFIERAQQELDGLLHPIIDDPQQTAVEKLRAYFVVIDRARVAQQGLVSDMFHVWYTDENAIVREKVASAVRARRAPLLAQIIRQGIAERTLTVTYPEQATDVVLSLLQGLGDTHAAQLLTRNGDDEHVVAAIVATHAAYMEGLERLLGAPANCLDRVSLDAVRSWLTALHASAEDALASPIGGVQG